MSCGMPITALEAAPSVNWRHVDGPMLMWAGRIHWLTWRERFAIWTRRETVETVAQKHWPSRAAWASRA